jgi:UDP-3-O-[3-hydroxymyristoyl] glucosamine N-acyltransferase
MKTSLDLNLEKLIEIVQPERTEGILGQSVNAIASLDEAQFGDLSFLGNKKYAAQVHASKASVIIVPLDYTSSQPVSGQLYLFVKNPSAALGKICKIVESMLFPNPEASIHQTAVIHSSVHIDGSVHVGAYCVIEEGAKIGKNVVLRAHTYVGRYAQIGDDCYLMPHVSVMDYCVLGARVRIQSGAVIGSDGFGYETVSGVHHREAQVGYVKLEDDVEIGANTTIDRARFSVTLIGTGTKIDNLVQLAHNVRTGPHCIIVSQVGISGSTVLGHHVVLGGQVGMGGHLKIGDGAMIGGQSGLNEDIPAGAYVRGSPPHPFQLAHRIEILKSRLPELFKRVNTIEDQLGIERLRPSERGKKASSA